MLKHHTGKLVIAILTVLVVAGILTPLLLASADFSYQFLPSPTSTPTATSTQPASPYLELSVSPPAVLPGTLFTLYITYHNIGLPYTNIQIDPSDIVVYEPALSMPCKYNEHPNGCTAITLRALAPGVVTFRASAGGEIFDQDCHCWYMGGASDNGPATLVITSPTWTDTVTTTYTLTPSLTPTATETFTPTATATMTPTLSQTPSPTLTPTITEIPTVSYKMYLPLVAR